MGIDMDTEQLHARLDRLDDKLDRIEVKLDTFATQVTTHASQLDHLRGFSRIVISLLTAALGFLAVAFFGK